MRVTFLTDKDRKELERKIEEASESGSVSDEQIADAVEDYFEENPIEGATGTIIRDITIEEV